MSQNDTLPSADGKNDVENATKDSTLQQADNQEQPTEATSEEPKIETPETVSETADTLESTTPEGDALIENTTENSTEQRADTQEQPVEVTSEEPKTETPETVLETTDTLEPTTPEGDAHVEDIEESNAEDAEDDANAERHDLEKKDYHSMGLEQLVSEFEKLLKNHKIQTISSLVNEIKSEFNTKFSALLDEKKEQFEADGGNPIDFYFTNDAKKRFNTAYKIYKQTINAYYKEREQSLKQNLENRLAIIEDIKGLLNVEENINTTYKHFKELQEKWRNAGPIPRDKYNNAWNTYHHHVERFYDFLHLNRDLRDMDFKHNLEQKQKIIEQAEALTKEENINLAFRQLQVLHKLWKEELGPVAKEYRDSIWERFSAATKLIHDKRQAYYADLDKAYEKNLERKEAIIEQINALNAEDTKAHNVWQKRIKELETLRESFFNAGKVPLKVNEATWAKFKDAVRAFNRSKNAFYKNLKKDQFENLQKKRDLIKVAEDNKDSDDFETITPLMKKIQSEWKQIGHVPRRDSDKIWKQFKNACNHYFDRLHAERKAENQELYDAFDKKKALLESVKAFSYSDDPKKDIATLQGKIKEWKSIGFVPQNKRFIDGKFYKAIDAAFDKLEMDKSKVEMIRFESKLENISDTEDTRLLDNEQNFVRKKIDDLKSEINQLENNLLFFSNVKDDNPMVKDVHKNIANHKKELVSWEKKLKKIRDMYS